MLILDKKGPENNMRNGEGAFLTLANGAILYAYTRYRGHGNSDDHTADVAAMLSTDGGRSFRESGIIASCDETGAKNVMSISLLQMQNGDIGVFYLLRQTGDLMRMVLRRSADLGKTWSEPVLCMNETGYYVVNNDRVLRLSDGTILIPAAQHRKDGAYFDALSDAVFFLSRDDGRTWEKAPGKVSMPHTAHAAHGLQEPLVIELAPGFLWGLARTDLGRQYEFFSHDGGLHWTGAEPGAFTSPNSPLCMKRLTDGRLFAVWNPVPIYPGHGEFSGTVWTGGRSPLVYAVSADNGATFSEPVSLETDPESGFCYTSIHETEDGILLAYYAGSREDGSLFHRLRIRKIPKPE